MDALVLKLTITPILIAVATLVGRRFGGGTSRARYSIWYDVAIPIVATFVLALVFITLVLAYNSRCCGPSRGEVFLVGEPAAR
jgi:ABC-type Mn2+/Zn2+ transport system permease subunit